MLSTKLMGRVQTASRDMVCRTHAGLREFGKMHSYTQFICMQHKSNKRGRGMRQEKNSRRQDATLGSSGATPKSSKVQDLCGFKLQPSSTHHKERECHRPFAGGPYDMSSWWSSGSSTWTEACREKKRIINLQ